MTGHSRFQASSTSSAKVGNRMRKDWVMKRVVPRKQGRCNGVSHQNPKNRFEIDWMFGLLVSWLVGLLVG